MLLLRRMVSALLAAATLPAASCVLDVSGQGASPETAGAGATGSGGRGGGGGAPAAPPIEVAGQLLVALDATDPAGVAGTWTNRGELGDFTAVGTPALGSFGSVEAVEFDGESDAYEGPASVPTIEGDDDRTIEVWVNNPTVDSHEETMVSWSDRGGPGGTMVSFNYGDSGTWGAMTHWGDSDLGWGASGPPAPGEWHHLVYTHDGTTARVYADGVEEGAKPATLSTRAGSSINIAAQRRGQELQFVNEYDGVQQAGSLWIAVVRVHSGALTAAQVQANLEAEAPRFHGGP
jgi:hypothetical protein